MSEQNVTSDLLRRMLRRAAVSLCGVLDYLTACSTLPLDTRRDGSSSDVTTNQNDTLGVLSQTTMFDTLVKFRKTIKTSQRHEHGS